MSQVHPFREFPKHLYHKSAPARIVHNAVEEAEARKDGYVDGYMLQQYPKHINRIKLDADGKAVLDHAGNPVIITTVVNNRQEEAAAIKES
jgi:predicted TIM-barrel fold metal-dependent hydrolase